ncbi:MAG TPA: hypothetical protein EYN67_09205, partial [Flavobacteriales bacterium]|nr:hypothetical protein [Flavobacteriales bacterium]
MSERKLYHTDHLGHHQIRHFTFTDHEVSTFNKGEYRYSVRIKVRDGIRDWLSYKIFLLRKSTKELEKYYNICTQSRFYRPDINRFKPAFKEYCENTGWPIPSTRPWDGNNGPFYNALMDVWSLFATNTYATDNAAWSFTGLTSPGPTMGAPKHIKYFLVNRERAARFS